MGREELIAQIVILSNIHPPHFFTTIIATNSARAEGDFGLYDTRSE